MPRGEVAEWSKAAVSKVACAAKPGVVSPLDLALGRVLKLDR